MTIIGIAGKGGSGKSTLGSILENRFGYFHTFFAKALKHKAKEEFGLLESETNGEHKERVSRINESLTNRQIMQRIGQFYRSIYPEFWVKRTMHEVMAQDNQYVVISDVRFKNEADLIRELGGHVVRLEREESLLRTSADISETALDHYEHFLFCVGAEENSTMDQLEQTAVRIYTQFRSSSGYSI